MNKKIIVIILIIILLVIGAVAYNGLNKNGNNIKVGDTYFTLPEGYFKGDLVNSWDANITNGTTSLGIKEYPGSNIQKYIDNYIDSNKNKNYTTKVHKINTGGIEVYKSEIAGNNETFHYWFINNDKVYEIFTWDGNNQTDNIVFDLIKSSKENHSFF